MAEHLLKKGPYAKHRVVWSPALGQNPTDCTILQDGGTQLETPRILVKDIAVEDGPDGPSGAFAREREVARVLLQQPSDGLSWLQRPLSEVEIREGYGASRTALLVLEAYGPTTITHARDHYLDTDLRNDAEVDGREEEFRADHEDFVARVAVCGHDALTRLSALGFAHRDPHPGNLLVVPRPHVADEKDIEGVVLIDFGHATPLVNRSTEVPAEATIGYPPCQAPELWEARIRGTVAGGTLANRLSDLFGLGVTLVILLTDHSPWVGPDGEPIPYRPIGDLTEKIERREITYVEPASVADGGRLDIADDDLRTVVLALTREDPAVRAAAIKDAASALARLRERLGLTGKRRLVKIGKVPTTPVFLRAPAPQPRHIVPDPAGLVADEPAAQGAVPTTDPAPRAPERQRVIVVPPPQGPTVAPTAPEPTPAADDARVPDPPRPEPTAARSPIQVPRPQPRPAPTDETREEERPEAPAPSERPRSVEDGSPRAGRPPLAEVLPTLITYSVVVGPLLLLGLVGWSRVTDQGSLGTAPAAAISIVGVLVSCLAALWGTFRSRDRLPREVPLAVLVVAFRYLACAAPAAALLGVEVAEELFRRSPWLTDRAADWPAWQWGMVGSAGLSVTALLLTLGAAHRLRVVIPGLLVAVLAAGTCALIGDTHRPDGSASSAGIVESEVRW